VVATTKFDKRKICFTSYEPPRAAGVDIDLFNSVKIWEACRATSAATSFFEPIKLGEGGEWFVDGGKGANNPIMQIWGEAHAIWASTMQPLSENINCVVSIGTGVLHARFRDEAVYLFNSLRASATDARQTHEAFEDSHPYLASDGRYYRFDVDYGLHDIGLGDSQRIDDIWAATRGYFSNGNIAKKLENCGRILKERGGKFMNYFVD
jgi:predicted acylesterase/phospholipase RssA